MPILKIKVKRNRNDVTLEYFRQMVSGEFCGAKQMCREAYIAVAHDRLHLLVLFI